MKVTASSIMWVVVVVITLGVLAFVLSGSTSSQGASPSPQNTNGVASSSADTSGSVPETATSSSPASASTSTALLSARVTYGANGFSPATVTIAKGGTVTFTDTGNNKMWVASDPHPTHEGYSGTTVSQHCPDTAGVAFDQCSAGTTYTFKFEKVGTWGYHNHTSVSDRGTVIVK